MCTLLWIVTVILALWALFATDQVRKQVAYIRRNWPGHLNSFFGQFAAIHRHLGLGLPVEPPRRLLVRRIRLMGLLWLASIAGAALITWAC